MLRAVSCMLRGEDCVEISETDIYLRTIGDCAQADMFQIL